MNNVVTLGQTHMYMYVFFNVFLTQFLYVPLFSLNLQHDKYRLTQLITYNQWKDPRTSPMWMYMYVFFNVFLTQFLYVPLFSLNLQHDKYRLTQLITYNQWKDPRTSPMWIFRRYTFLPPLY